MPLTTSDAELNARAQGRRGAEKDQLGATRFASLRLGVFALKGGEREGEAQRASILQPKVAQHALPWETRAEGNNPEGVAESPSHNRFGVVGFHHNDPG